MTAVTGFQVSSSTILAIGHDRVKSRLFIQFKRDALSFYSYENVSTQLFESLIKATSVGTYFSSQIRSKTEYPSTKLSVTSASEVFSRILPVTAYGNRSDDAVLTPMPSENLAWCW